MELSWVNKLRIAAVAALGIVTIGILAWPLAAPEDPMVPLRSSDLSFLGTMALLALAFASGFAAYFLAWPHGREIGILAVPFGLTIWAARSGPMRTLTQAFEETYERQALLHSLRFEPAYWLAVVAAGFAGVLLAQYLRPSSVRTAGQTVRASYRHTGTYIGIVAALAVAVLVSHFSLGVFVQDLSVTPYNVVTPQPEVAQIIFAVVAAFAVAGFVVKKFLGMSYIWPSLATMFVIAFSETTYYGSATVKQFAETFPATFFPHGVFAVTPLQLAALGALGSVVGFWLAVRYDHWRKHGSV